MNTLLLDALKCKNQSRPPVWLMRQAGRYMPQYRELRSRYSLWHLFHEPELAAQVTLQPIDILGVDAAILFSDILVIAEVFGLEVVFPEGAPPQIVPLVTSTKNLARKNVEETLSYVKRTIELLKPQLKVPLIGFCGGPFTLATYMTGKALNWITEDKAEFHCLLDIIAEVLIEYLLMQIRAGVDAIQIFDSWANLLTPAQFFEFSHAYLKKIVDALRPTGVPIILFSRASSQYPAELAEIHPAGISFDWQENMLDLRRKVPPHIAVQGNLDPEFFLKASAQDITTRTNALLEMMRGDPGFIANLGHGVLPGTPMENVHAFVQCVKSSL